MQNTDPKNGVRYGVMVANHVPHLWEDIELIPTNHCPYCGEFSEDLVNQDQCPNCNKEFDEFTDFPHQSILDKDGVKGFLTDDGYLFVTESPYITYCRLCSPCMPNAGDLDSYDGRHGYVTYCLPPDYFEEEMPYVAIPLEVQQGKRKPTVHDTLDVVLQLLRAFPQAKYIPGVGENDHTIKDYNKGQVVLTDQDQRAPLPEGCIVGVALTLLGVNWDEFEDLFLEEKFDFSLGDEMNLSIAECFYYLAKFWMAEPIEEHKENLNGFSEQEDKLDFIQSRNDQKCLWGDILQDYKDHYKITGDVK